MELGEVGEVVEKYDSRQLAWSVSCKQRRLQIQSSENRKDGRTVIWRFILEDLLECSTFAQTNRKKMEVNISRNNLISYFTRGGGGGGGEGIDCGPIYITHIIFINRNFNRHMQICTGSARCH